MEIYKRQQFKQILTGGIRMKGKGFATKAIHGGYEKK